MRALLLLLPLLLTACGFQLRGQYKVPEGLNPVAIRASGPVALDLTAALKRQGIAVIDGAPLAIRVNYESINRQNLTLNSLDDAAEVMMLYDLSWQLVYASGVPAIPERVLHLRDYYQFDNTRVLGKSEEEGMLKSELRQQAVAQIMGQLSHMNMADLAPDVTAKSRDVIPPADPLSGYQPEPMSATDDDGTPTPSTR